MIGNFIFQIITIFALFIGIYELLGNTVSEETKKKYLPYLNDPNFIERIQYTPYLMTKSRGWFYLVIGIICLVIGSLGLIPIDNFCGKNRLIIIISSVFVLAILSINSKKYDDKTKQYKVNFTFGDELGNISYFLKDDFLQTISVLLGVGTLTDFLSKSIFNSY